jgi:hypothetical protein
MQEPSVAARKSRGMTLKAERTLVKSEPELHELMSADPRLNGEGIVISLAEKGFGTHVEISADEAAGLERSDLEQILDQLAEPQKRPFTAT